MTHVRSSISASLIFHFALVIAALGIWQQNEPISRPIWIELEPSSSRSREENREDSKKQIVQTLPGNPVESAPKDAFLGEGNQTVDRQTVSNKRTTVVGQAAPPSETSKPSDKAQEQATADHKASTKIGAIGALGLPLLSQDQNKSDEQRRFEREHERKWVSSGTQLQDYVKGLKEGEQTALNTSEYVFYGYFHRIRERLDRAWVPILRERLVKWFHAGRQLASEQEHATRVLVVLNGTGQIKRIEIVNESGVQMLDDAAVQAFNRAGPFPNPPRGLVNTSGEVRIPWEFVLRT